MLLAIYLNDHLAGATAGRELARRAVRSNRGSSHGFFLADLADQIDADRGSLLAIMRVLNVRVDRVKVVGGWGAEKLGRLKFDRQLLGYSPLSRIVGSRRSVSACMATRAVANAAMSWPRRAQPGARRARRSHRPRRAAARGLESHRLQAVAQAFS